jgi:hypothetical protein
MTVMTDQPVIVDARRQTPQNTVQAAAAISSEVVGSLGKSPIMFGVIVLNLVGIMAAVYFLNLLIHGQQQHLANLLTMQREHLKEILDGHQAQMREIIAVHNREFDALAEMLKPGSTGTLPPRQR